MVSLTLVGSAKTTQIECTHLAFVFSRLYDMLGTHMTVEVELSSELVLAGGADDHHNSEGSGGCILNETGTEVLGTADG